MTRGCYTFSVVEYVKLGRKLGVGTRVAAKILRDRAQNQTQTASSAASAKPSVGEVQAPPNPQPRQTATPSRKIDPKIDPRTAARNATRSVARGSRGFGRAFWKPFSHAMRSLAHEITGVFFAILAAFFGQGLWRDHNAWRSGPEHSHFVVYLVMFLVFGYFSVSAFVSSRGPQR